MKLMCIQDVVDSDGRVVFVNGQPYDFHLHTNGSIYKFEGNICHGLTGNWLNYFTYEDKR